MSCCRSCIDCLPVLAVLALFAYVYYTYVVVLCMHTLEYLVQRIIYSLIFHIFFFMALLSYFITMCKEHEYVPSYYKLPTMDYEMFKIAGTEDEKNRILDGFCRSRAIRIYTTTATGAIRFCSKCKHVKPDRTHHCSTCKTCIPKMDHHCPWVNNCVGFANYKIFIVFLIYTALTCIFVTATLLEHFTYYWITDTNNINDHQLLALFVFAVCLVIILLSFLLYHLSLISKNQTTLEALREPQFKEGSLSFDLGCRSNFEEVFGDNWECWFCPKNTSLGDGFEFPLQVDI